jgi:hypothetical protein
MRTHRIALLAGFLSLLSAAVASACGGYGDPPAPLKLPGLIARSLIRGNQLYAVTTDGQFFAVDLNQNTVRTIGKCEGTRAPVLDVASDKACLVDRTRVRVIDLKDGAIVRSKDLGQNIQDAGFLGDMRVYVAAGSRLTVIDLTEDKILHVIDLPKPSREATRVAVTTDESGRKRLLVPMGAEQAEKATLAVIDAETGKVIDQIPLPGMPLGQGIYSVGDLQVVGDKVHMVCWRFSYGVWTQSLGCVDLKEKKFTLLKLPAGDLMGPNVTIASDGKLFLTGHEGTHQYDAQGKLLGEIFRKEGRLVGVWRGQALLVTENELHRSALPKIPASPE